MVTDSTGCTHTQPYLSVMLVVVGGETALKLLTREGSKMLLFNLTFEVFMPSQITGVHLETCHQHWKSPWKTKFFFLRLLFWCTDILPTCFCLLMNVLLIYVITKVPNQAARRPWGWAPRWTSRGSKGWTCSTNSCYWPNTTRPGGTQDTSAR